MKEQIWTWIVALPLGAAMGWAASKLFGPTMDALGVALQEQLSHWANRKRVAHAAYQELETLVSTNHTTNGHNRFYERKTYLRDPAISAFMLKHGSFMRRSIKNAWIEGAIIDSYNESDVFFAGMDLLFPELRKKDVQAIFEKFHNNNQAGGLFRFLEKVEEQKPRFLSTDALEHLRALQKMWSDKHGNV